MSYVSRGAKAGADVLKALVVVAAVSSEGDGDVIWLRANVRREGTSGEAADVQVEVGWTGRRGRRRVREKIVRVLKRECVSVRGVEEER